MAHITSFLDIEAQGDSDSEAELENVMGDDYSGKLERLYVLHLLLNTQPLRGWTKAGRRLRL